MENFFKTEEGKIIGHVIHDSNTGIGLKRIKDTVDYGYVKFKEKQPK